MNKKPSLILRKVTKGDENLLLNWKNDFDVRRGSFNNKSIKSDEHKLWFRQKFIDKNVLFWILEFEHKPAGMVRMEKKRKEILLNYLIAPQSRGKKFASKMLKMAIVELNNHWKDINVVAYTLPENIPSIRSLEKAGFILRSSSVKKKCYVFNARGN